MIKSECICLDMMEGLWGTPGSSFSRQIILQQGALIWIDQDKKSVQGSTLAGGTSQGCMRLLPMSVGASHQDLSPLKHGAFLLK